MKEIISAVALTLMAATSLAISVNVNPYRNKPVRVRTNKCAPSSVKFVGNKRYVCNSKGYWVRRGTRSAPITAPGATHVKTPAGTVHISP